MLPFEGVKVIEFAQFVAAPICGRVLAEWGAEVIKIESLTGDHNREQGLINGMPIEEDDDPTMDSTSVNKRFISVNPRSAEGVAVIHHLLERADVFLTNYREKVLESLGLDWPTLHEKYPGLVWTRVTGFGEEGPDKDAPGYDTVSCFARGGISGTWYPKGTEPLIPMAAFGDNITGMMLAGGVAAALYRKTRTGEGDKVAISLFHVGIFGNSWATMATEFHVNDPEPPYPQSRAQATNPGNIAYPSADRWIQFGCPVWINYYDKIMKCIGRNDLIGNTELNDLETIQKTGRIVELEDIIENEMRKRPSAEWLKIFKEEGVPVQLCATFEDIVVDEQAWESKVLFKAKTTGGHEHIYVNIPVRLGCVGDPQERMRMSQPVGTDTRQVLRENGYSDEEIDDMALKKAIRVCD
jgi:cinnamoyl-CoA:phenyllactate CoA-transferase